LAYRLQEAGQTLVYMPDHEPALTNGILQEYSAWTSGLALAEGADLLIHDSQYTDKEYREHVGWGHSSIEQAIDFGQRAAVKRLMTFHHDPSHTDADLERMHSIAENTENLNFELVAGTEGLSLEVGSGQQKNERGGSNT
jgi:ribonuclease BN (tRNA processing enzyme)